MASLEISTPGYGSLDTDIEMSYTSAAATPKEAEIALTVNGRILEFYWHDKIRFKL